MRVEVLNISDAPSGRAEGTATTLLVDGDTGRVLLGQQRTSVDAGKVVLEPKTVAAIKANQTLDAATLADLSAQAVAETLIQLNAKASAGEAVLDG